jgi:hypothetical protein
MESEAPMDSMFAGLVYIAAAFREVGERYSSFDAYLKNGLHLRAGTLKRSAEISSPTKPTCGFLSASRT